MKKKSIIFLFCLIFIIACSKEEKASLPALKKVNLPEGLVGNYSGRLPCDDCKIRQIKLTLNKDSSAIAIENILRDSVYTNELKGHFSVKEGTLIVSLNEDKTHWNFIEQEYHTLSFITSAGTIYKDENGMPANLIRIYSPSELKDAQAKEETSNEQ